MRAVSGVRTLLFPESIAVVGASPRNDAAVEAVLASGVRAFGVNPNRTEVAGLECYPTVAELPEVPNCAFLMVNHERVEDAFEEAAAVRAGVGVAAARGGPRLCRPRRGRGSGSRLEADDGAARGAGARARGCNARA